MTRSEFGQLIAALRRENIDPVQGKVWTQKRLAQEAGLLERTIGQIEQGAKTSLEPQMLVQLANALELTSLERKALLSAAAEVDLAPQQIINVQPAKVLAGLLEQARNLRLPAFIYDSYHNVLAANGLILALGAVPATMLQSGAASPAGFNLLRYYFAPESSYREVLAGRWTQFAIRNVQHFRAASLPYRHTARFQRVFQDLYQYPLFRDFWARTKYAGEDIHHRWEGIEFHHPRLGQLSYMITEVVTLTGEEELFLVTYIPRNSDTVVAFEKLAQEIGVNMHKLMSWPYGKDGSI
ncbi:MAG: helix-turn-helix domain-containing protein [Caldilineaceae bacterium]|nr:helix-turn-helix domain-containing protein [Caldilineaceae bacterium]MCB0097865.1 helix-turn-helix domain-containing protein [Caldilineaceae bacterium]MCB0143936.1 helix-turn-helix domain-containing protein [Caldilineaceae bacterium]